MLYHWAAEDSVASKGQIAGIDWNRNARLHSHVLAHMNSLTASQCHIKAYRDASNQPADHRVLSSSVVEHTTRSRRVVGSNPIWDSDFFRVYFSPIIYVISCWSYSWHHILYLCHIWCRIEVHNVTSRSDFGRAYFESKKECFLDFSSTFKASKRFL